MATHSSICKIQSIWHKQAVPIHQVPNDGWSPSVIGFQERNEKIPAELHREETSVFGKASEAVRYVKRILRIVLEKLSHTEIKLWDYSTHSLNNEYLWVIYIQILTFRVVPFTVCTVCQHKPHYLLYAQFVNISRIIYCMHSLST